MTHETAAPQATPHRPGYFSPQRLGRDYAYVLPGLFISLFGFIVLVPLFALSIGTFVIWVGALLLPLTLTIARGFAQLSRARVRHWGMPSAPAHYRPPQPGVTGWVKSIADPRLWLDLVFETIIALPLRMLTFTVAVSWSVAAASGLTYVIWGAFLPDDGSGALKLLLAALFDDVLPSSVTDSFALEALSHVVLGALFLLSLPAVIHALARLDAVITAGALGSGEGGPGPAPGAAGPPPANPHDPSARPHGHGPDPHGHSPDSHDRSPDPHDQSPRSYRLSPDSYEHGPGSYENSPGSHRHSPQAWAWLTAGFAAAVLVAVSWPVTAVVYGVPVVLSMVVALIQSAALVTAVRWPVVSIIGGTAAIFAMAWATGSALGLPWPWPVTTLISTGLLVLVLALRRPWPYAIAAWLAGIAASVLAVLLLRTDGASGAIDSVLIAGPVSAGLVALGISIRQLARSRARLRDAEEASAQQTAQRRELAERNRIAQELHDVVAHSMSVISVQATTAEYRLPDIGNDSAQEFASIADSSRRALNEMRGLLTILRGSGDAPLVPQPTLLDVPDLLDATRRSGTTITVSTDTESAPETGTQTNTGTETNTGTAADASATSVPARSDAAAFLEATAPRVSTATGLTAYRILQEALSNAVRHAPGADISVVFGLSAFHITLEVENGPSTAAPSVRGPQTVRGPQSSASAFPPGSGGGLGLAGIRERAAALGGTVDAGPRPDGGFTVHARLPTL